MAKNTKEATDIIAAGDAIADTAPADDAIDDPPIRVTVRALVDLQIGDNVIKAGQVTELDADIVNNLIEYGQADGNADAIAYALSA